MKLERIANFKDFYPHNFNGILHQAKLHIANISNYNRVLLFPLIINPLEMTHSYSVPKVDSEHHIWMRQWKSGENS